MALDVKVKFKSIAAEPELLTVTVTCVTVGTKRVVALVFPACFHTRLWNVVGSCCRASSNKFVASNEKKAKQSKGCAMHACDAKFSYDRPRRP